MDLTGLLSRSDLYYLDERVHAEIDKKLDIVTGGDEQLRLRVKHSVERLLAASRWLTMMQQCVVSDDAVIKLDSSVHVTLHDYYIS
jgi:hypothetical protein